MIWLIVVCVAVAACYDMKSRIVPDWIPGAILLFAAAQVFMAEEPEKWHMAVGVGLGAALGTMVGLILFQFCGFGGGDAKLIAALGAVLGPGQLCATCFWIAVAGGMWAVFAQVRGQRDIAYVPAIAIGTVCHGVLSEHLWVVLNL